MCVCVVRYLGKNPYVCDCNLLWLASFAAAHAALEMSDVVCEAPERLARRRLVDLPHADLRCRSLAERARTASLCASLPGGAAGAGGALGLGVGADGATRCPKPCVCHLRQTAPSANATQAPLATTPSPADGGAHEAFVDVSVVVNCSARGLTELPDFLPPATIELYVLLSSHSTGTFRM